jgi:hypothetical protein
LPRVQKDSALGRLALAWMFVSSSPIVPAHLTRKRKHLNEQPLDLLAKSSPERRNRV